MTKRQKEIVDFIRSFYLERGFSPSYEEIGSAVGISKPTVWEHIRSLAKRGVIKHEKGAIRGILLVENEGRFTCPRCGYEWGGRNDN